MHRFSRTIAVVMVGLLAAVGFAESKPATKPATRLTGFARWEKDIAAFEKKDMENPPVKGGVVMTGSSTIVRWKTMAKDLPGVNVLNRAFGGSQIVDATHFADRIIVPYQPRMVVIRSGGNDIHAGKSAERVFNDYKDFVATVHAKLPNATIVYISLCPAPVRWSERQANKKLNDLVKAFTDTEPYLKYIETYDMTVTSDDKPREDLFVADRLHPNAEGYKLLADRVRPVVTEK